MGAWQLASIEVCPLAGRRPIEEFRSCRDRTAFRRTHRIDHGRGTIRVGSVVVDDDRGDGLPDAQDDPGADATGRLGHERDASAEVQEPRHGRRSFGHRGSGFGPVAVTSRCGTQSSTWLKPSKRTPPRMQPSYNERR
jgi:hypothetical protein